jgi:hypothetical protein
MVSIIARALPFLLRFGSKKVAETAIKGAARSAAAGGVLTTIINWLEGTPSTSGGPAIVGGGGGGGDDWRKNIDDRLDPPSKKTRLEFAAQAYAHWRTGVLTRLLNMINNYYGPPDAPNHPLTPEANNMG